MEGGGKERMEGGGSRPGHALPERPVRRCFIGSCSSRGVGAHRGIRAPVASLQAAISHEELCPEVPSATLLHVASCERVKLD